MSSIGGALNRLRRGWTQDTVHKRIAISDPADPSLALSTVIRKEHPSCHRIAPIRRYLLRAIGAALFGVA